MFLFVCVTLWWHPWQQDFSMWQAASAMDVAQATTFLGFSRGLLYQQASEPIVIDGVTWVAPNKWPKTNG